MNSNGSVCFMVLKKKTCPSSLAAGRRPACIVPLERCTALWEQVPETQHSTSLTHPQVIHIKTAGVLTFHLRSKEQYVVKLISMRNTLTHLSCSSDGEDKRRDCGAAQVEQTALREKYKQHNNVQQGDSSTDNYLHTNWHWGFEPWDLAPGISSVENIHHFTLKTTSVACTWHYLNSMFQIKWWCM